MTQQIRTQISARKWIISFIALLTFVWLFGSRLQNLYEWFSDREAIVGSIEQLGIWGPVVLFLLLVLQVFLAIIPGHALMLAGSYSFGFWPSFLITAASTVLGSQIAFMIGRRWGRSIVNGMADGEVIQRWDKLAKGQGAMFFFFSFVLPIFPSDLMTYVAGLGTISAKRFLVANISGRIVVAGFITLIGAQGFQMPAIFWAAAVLGMSGLFIGWHRYASIHAINLSKKNKIPTSEGQQVLLTGRTKCA
jgi:uncharacterized membrane protein YdjX (TVP38/TMEM64 family)